ncbi:MAG TPA: Rsd/AlgQ family anti-sigma factor, partial [Firmicutes bacterium]|nr:Rsd/AlgQ family anti-sigma factor [Bacillota bacterium]
MSVEQLEERRQSVRNKFHTLLETRTETLALFSALIGMRPFKPETEVQLVLQEFCESLVDYSASAHFQLYSYIESGTEQRFAELLQHQLHLGLRLEWPHSD